MTMIATKQKVDHNHAMNLTQNENLQSTMEANKQEQSKPEEENKKLTMHPNRQATGAQTRTTKKHSPSTSPNKLKRNVKTYKEILVAAQKSVVISTPMVNINDGITANHCQGIQRCGSDGKHCRGGGSTTRTTYCCLPADTADEIDVMEIRSRTT